MVACRVQLPSMQAPSDADMSDEDEGDDDDDDDDAPAEKVNNIVPPEELRFDDVTQDPLHMISVAIGVLNRSCVCSCLQCRRTLTQRVVKRCCLTIFSET